MFIDVAGLSPGVDFARAIGSAVAGCDVLLAVIGPDWATCADGQGRRRLDDPADLVRVEIAAALGGGVAVVPVLIGGAALPSPERLPADLRPLTQRQAIELRDARWDADTRELVSALEHLIGVPKGRRARPRKRMVAWLATAVVAAAAIAVPAARYFNGANASMPPATPPPTPAGAPAAAERVLDNAFSVRPSIGPDTAPLRVPSDRIFSAGDLILRFCPQSAGRIPGT